MNFSADIICIATQKDTGEFKDILCRKYKYHERG